MEGDIYFAHGNANARGVSVLIHPQLHHIVKQVRSDNEGRIVNILLDIDDHISNIVNVYAPNNDSERGASFTDLNRFLSSSHKNIIASDFNCIFDAKLDKFGGEPNPRHSAVFYLNALIARFALCNIWRRRHKDEQNFTWTRKNISDNTFIWTRIDFFLTSKSLHPYIRAFANSDHDYILLTLNFDQVLHGPGFWHLNNDLLSDSFFKHDIECFWGDWKTKMDNLENPLFWWDNAKFHFKLISIRCAKIRGKLRRHKRLQLEQQLERLQLKAQSGNAFDIERFLLVKEKVKQLDIRDLESTKIGAKARFMEDGEKSSRYFFSLEKQLKADHTIRVPTKDNMDTVTDPHDLLCETHDFYSNLYSAQSCEKLAFFLDVDFPKLTEEARASCDDRLTEEELREAVFSMENNKSPGVDRLSTNFYKHIWPLFSDKLLLVYNYAFASGCLSVSQRRGIIPLVFKKGNRILVKNWKPITLLTTDYKILAKALGNHLQRVLSLIVHRDQTASVKGLMINDNVRLLHVVIYYANYCDTPLAVISVDQLKAFDRVSHDFLFTILDAFDFGPAFTQWIHVLYNSVSSSVLTNGWLTSFIGLRRGLRQGCALSMPLYVLTAEALAINIRANSKIHGLLPPGPTDVEVKVTQFADDTTLLLVDDDSIAEAFQTFDLYERASGAEINKYKCKG